MKSVQQLINETTEDYFLLMVNADDIELQEQAFRMALADIVFKALSQHLEAA